MNFEAHQVYHVYNQGNNHEILFREEDDYLIFLNLIRSLVFPHCEIIAYCLMPNHFHLMVYVDERILSKTKQGGLLLDPLSNAFRKLLSGFARIMNKKYERSGSLFRQKTKVKLLTEASERMNEMGNGIDYCIRCFHYVHQNPMKAGLVKKLEEWIYSSVRDYAGVRNGSLCNKLMAVQFCNYHPDTFILESYSSVDVDFDSFFE